MLVRIPVGRRYSELPKGSQPLDMRMVENLGPTRQQTIGRQRYRARATSGLREKEITRLLSMG